MTSTPSGRESAFARVRQFTRKPATVARCDMCNRELHSEHEHLLEPVSRKLVCACDACAILFESQSATRYKRVPRRALFLQNFLLTDAQWEGLRVPIEMVFFFRSTPLGRVVALYPSPAGAMESQLSLDTWAGIEAMNPVLRGMEPDVRGLLVNRVKQGRGSTSPEYYLAPIDECYKLVGLIRTHWRGFSGGSTAWEEIRNFFSVLKSKAAQASGGLHA